MKKLMLCVLLLVAAPLTFAEEATGTIEQIKICGAGHSADLHWARTLQFKVDGKWFGTLANYYGSPNYDNNATASILFMAYSQNLEVHVKATGSWNSYFTSCGNTEGTSFYDNAGDFISLSK